MEESHEVSAMEAFSKRVAELFNRHKSVREDALALALEIRDYRKVLRKAFAESDKRDQATRLALAIEKKLMGIVGPAVEIKPDAPAIIMPGEDDHVVH